MSMWIFYRPEVSIMQIKMVIWRRDNRIEVQACADCWCQLFVTFVDLDCSLKVLKLKQKSNEGKGLSLRRKQKDLHKIWLTEKSIGVYSYSHTCMLDMLIFIYINLFHFLSSIILNPLNIYLEHWTKQNRNWDNEKQNRRESSASNAQISKVNRLCKQK